MLLFKSIVEIVLDLDHELQGYLQVKVIFLKGTLHLGSSGIKNVGAH